MVVYLDHLSIKVWSDMYFSSSYTETLKPRTKFTHWRTVSFCARIPIVWERCVFFRGAGVEKNKNECTTILFDVARRNPLWLTTHLQPFNLSDTNAVSHSFCRAAISMRFRCKLRLNRIHFQAAKQWVMYSKIYDAMKVYKIHKFWSEQWRLASLHA